MVVVVVAAAAASEAGSNYCSLPYCNKPLTKMAEKTITFSELYQLKQRKLSENDNLPQKLKR